jgi:hypothetical protein
MITKLSSASGPLPRSAEATSAFITASPRI